MKTRIALSVLILSSLVSSPGVASGAETTSPGAEAAAAVVADLHREATSSTGSTGETVASSADGTEASASAAGGRYLLLEMHGDTSVYADTEAGLDDAAWALGRFELAGLPLPAVEIWMSPDRSNCNDSAAYLTTLEDGTIRIRSCGTRFTLLHELGHAWDIGFLTEARREAFMDLRGLDSWKSATWENAAGEHAATALAWGLNDQRINLDQLKPVDPASMRRAYLSLVGRRPLWEEPLDNSQTALHEFELRNGEPSGTVNTATQVTAVPARSDRRPETAERLVLDTELVRTLRKPDLRAVADDRGRVGFLQVEAALAFRAMRDAAASDGVSLRFTSAWRSWRVQDRAYQHFLLTGLNLAGNQVPNIANPDHSNHPKGLAADLAMREGVAEWLQAHAREHGWYSISSEAWHWEYRGADEYLEELTEQPLPPFSEDRYRHEGFQSWL